MRDGSRPSSQSPDALRCPISLFTTSCRARRMGADPAALSANVQAKPIAAALSACRAAKISCSAPRLSPPFKPSSIALEPNVIGSNDGECASSIKPIAVFRRADVVSSAMGMFSFCSREHHGTHGCQGPRRKRPALERRPPCQARRRHPPPLAVSRPSPRDVDRPRQALSPSRLNRHSAHP